MKPNFNDQYNTVAVYSLIVILFTLLCFFIGFYFDDIIAEIGFVITILKPIIYGLIIAFLVFPMLRFTEDVIFAFVEKKKPHPKLRSTLSLTLTYIITALIVTSFVMIVVPQVAASYKDLENKIPGYVTAVQKWIGTTLAGLPEIRINLGSPAQQFVSPPVNADGSVPNVIISRINGSYNREMAALVRAQTILEYDAADVINDFISNSYRYFTDLTPYVFSAIMNLVTETKNLTIAVIISVYFLSSRKAIGARLKNVSRMLLPTGVNAAVLDFTALVNRIFIRFVYGKAIGGALLGYLCFVIMSIFKMPYAPLIALIIGITNIIPYIGPFLGAIPGAFIIFVSDPPMTLWFILLVIALQQLDFYFIEPYLLQSHIKLDAAWVIISVILMGGLFGLIGMFIGVPVFAVFYTILKRRTEFILAAKGLPVETEAWKGRSEIIGDSD